MAIIRLLDLKVEYTEERKEKDKQTLVEFRKSPFIDFT